MFHDRKRREQPGVLDAFRFETFFFEPWTGHGTVKDSLGFRRGTYEAHGRGRIENGRILLEHAHIFSNGMIQEGEWEILENREGRVVALERARDISGQGWPTQSGYRWAYLSPMSTPLGVKRVRAKLLYTSSGPGQARSSGTFTFLGVPVGSVTGEFHHDKA